MFGRLSLQNQWQRPVKNYPGVGRTKPLILDHWLRKNPRVERLSRPRSKKYDRSGLSDRIYFVCQTVATGWNLLLWKVNPSANFVLRFLFAFCNTSLLLLLFCNSRVEINNHKGCLTIILISNLVHNFAILFSHDETKFIINFIRCC